MSEDTKNTFSEDYVKELRSENASWRTKVRDLETKMSRMEMDMQLQKGMQELGIVAEPNWINVKEGQNVREALEEFAAKYPQLTSQGQVQTQEASATPEKPSIHSMKMSQTNSNNPGPSAGGSLVKKSLQEIKQDPKLRRVLTEQYKSLLDASSHQNEEV